MSHHSEREKKSDKSSHKTSKSKGDRRPGSSTKKQPQKPNDFEKTGGESAVVPEIAASELILEKELGTGCFGTVFLAKCRGKHVAVKKLHSQEMDEHALAEFKREVGFLTHLRHPNIVLFMGACIEPTNLAMVTEYLPRGDIHNLIHNSQLSKAKILQMACDVIEGMTWLHNSKPPIIHRDIKPNNLLVDENYTVKICDFGLSAYNPLGVLKSQSTPGTPLWMSPEVLRGESITEKTDVYSFGIVLWEMYTGLDPFEHHNDIETFIHAVCVDQERPPLDGLPQVVASIIADCWADDARVRPRFDALIPRVRNAIVDVTIDDRIGAHLWKQFYIGQHDVNWDSFVLEFFQACYEPISRDYHNEPKYKLLKAILSHQSAENTDMVSLERFGLFVKWFGPMGPQCLTDMTQTMLQPWFHGDLAKIPCEALLNGFAKRGLYIVRLSTTNPEETPYTISKYTKAGVEHLRVNRTKNGNGYYTQVKIAGKNKKIEEVGPVQILINKWAKALGLKSACPGSVYSQLCKNVVVTGYQQYDDSDD